MTASFERRLRAPFADAAAWDASPRTPLDTGSGRGLMTLIAHPKGVLIERLYRHGGLRRLLAPELFLKTSRAADEYACHRRLYEAGLPTVEPVGWASAPGPVPMLRRYYYYSVFLPGARPLPRVLQDGATLDLARQAAHILAMLWQQGVYHQDLNLNNWLVVDGRLLLIDFDKAKTTTQNPKEFLAACLGRMVRSGLKLGFSPYRSLFLRLLILSSSALEVAPREVLDRIPAKAFQLGRFRRIRWKITGGRQKNGEMW